MASSMIGTTMKLIIVILVLGLAIWGLGKLGAGETLKSLFPEFKPVELEIKYSGDEKVLYSRVIGYWIIDDGFTFKFYYETNPEFNGSAKDAGWQWTMAGIGRWINVDNDSFTDLKLNELLKTGFFRKSTNEELVSKNKAFIESLKDKSSEEGLRLIVTRVANNNAKLVVYLDEENNKGMVVPRKVLTYEGKDKNLGDLDGLIIRLNQISRRIVK